MIVVDASAVAEALLRRPAAAVVEHRIHDLRQSLHAPCLIDVEVANVVRRYAARGEIDSRRGSEALSDLVEFPMHRHPHVPLLHRIWELRHNLTAYDAAYVALAEVLGAPLVTRDARLAASSGHRAQIELI